MKMRDIQLSATMYSILLHGQHFGRQPILRRPVRSQSPIDIALLQTSDVLRYITSKYPFTSKIRITGFIRSFVGIVLCVSSVNTQSVVQVLGASSKQQIDGFGSSLAFMGQAIQNLPTTPRTAILQTLFSTTSGAGFSILRTRVSPYISSTPGQYDYVSDAEEVGTRYLVNQAKTFGVSRFLASVWTPPTYSKAPQIVNGGFINNSPTSFNNYAAFLYNYVKIYDQTYGIKWYAISLQNEPEIQTPYESCQWTSADLVNFLGTYLKPRFIQDSITALILAPESNEWQENTIAPVLNNGTSRGGVQIVAAHPYFAGEIQNGKSCVLSFVSTSQWSEHVASKSRSDKTFIALGRWHSHVRLRLLPTGQEMGETTLGY